MNESCHTYEWVMSHIHGSVMAHMYISKNVIHTQICIHFHTYVDIYISYEYLFSAILNFKNGLRRAKILERLYQLGCTRVFFPIFPCKFHMRGSAWWVGKKKMNLCAHVCVHVCMCVCLCVCVCALKWPCQFGCTRVGGGAWGVGNKMNLCAHVCVHVCWLYVHMCVCMCACVYVSLCMRVCVL